MVLGGLGMSEYQYAWAEAGKLIGTKMPARYHEAVALLADLRELARRDGGRLGYAREPERRSGGVMELSPQREDELVVQILRDQVGIDPRSLRPILRLTALGLVNSAWRNTRVEDWHAEGLLHDGDMLRISSHMSWRLDQLLWRWRTQTGIAPDAPAHSLDEISFDDFRWLGGRIYQWIVNPSRRLPTGVTLRDVARGTCRSWRTTRTRR
jgi:hypothetical protein